MREQCFGMYPTTLILILIEVILVLYNGEGVKASVAQGRFKTRSGDVVKIDPLRTGDQWGNQPTAKTKIPSRRKNSRIDETRAKRSLSRDLQSKSQLLKRSDVIPDRSTPIDEPPCPCDDVPIMHGDQVDLNNHRENFHLAELPYTDSGNSDYQFINEMIPEAVYIQPDMDDAESDFQLDYLGSSLDFPSHVIQADPPLQQVDNGPSIPGSVSEMNATDFHLQQNHLESSHDSETLLDLLLVQIASLLMPQRNTLPDDSVENQFAGLDIPNVDDVIVTILCRLARLIVYTLEPYTTVVNLVLKIVRWTINILGFFIPAIEQQGGPQPIGNSTSYPIQNSTSYLQSILDYLNPLKPATDPPKLPKPVTASVSFLQSILDHLNPFKPITNPSKVFQPVPESTSPLELLLDYFNPSSRIQSSDNTVIPILSVIDLLNTFKPPPGYPQPIGRPDESERKTDSLEPLRSRTNPEDSYLLGLKPFATGHPAEPPRSISDLLKPIEAIVDHLNPFKPTTDDQTPNKGVPDYPNAPASGDQKPSDVGSIHLKSIQSFIDYINSFKPRSDSLVTDQSVGQAVNKLGLRTESSQPSSPYMNSMEAHILKLNPFGIFGESAKHSRLPQPYRSVQPKDGGTYYSGPNTNTLNPAGDQSRTPQSVGVALDSSLWPIGPAELGSPEFLNLLSPNYRPAIHPQGPQYTLHHPRGANNCPNIPNDYHQLGDITRVYKPYTSNLNWNDAQLKCRGDGAELFLPEDQNQYDCVIGFAREMIGNDLRFYAGFHRSFYGESWTTAHGGPLPFEKWANIARDDDLMDENCGGILVSENNLNGFIGECCTAQLPFICEIRIPLKCL